MVPGCRFGYTPAAVNIHAALGSSFTDYVWVSVGFTIPFLAVQCIPKPPFYLFKGAKNRTFRLAKVGVNYYLPLLYATITTKMRGSMLERRTLVV